jgi:hypothetical protein
MPTPVLLSGYNYSCCSELIFSSPSIVAAHVTWKDLKGYVGQEQQAS